MTSSSIERPPGPHSILPEKLLREFMQDPIKTAFTLQANIGNQNYAIPAGTEMSKYDTVLIWCRAFSVLFGSADLKSQ
jgi:hypothetical protein